MMTNQQYLLVKLAEELMEAGQMALKCSHFGMHEQQPNNPLSNCERLHGELNDVMASIEMLNDEEGFGFLADQEAIDTKVVKVIKYRQYSVDLGLVAVL